MEDGTDSVGGPVEELLLVLVCSGALLKLSSVLIGDDGSGSVGGGAEVPEGGGGADLKWRFLAVFLPLKFADWVMGPYMYDLLAEKGFSAGQIAGFYQITCWAGAAYSMLAGSLVDLIGRRAGTMAASLCYGLGALSLVSDSWELIAAGRIATGIGVSLLFTAPEAWLMSETANRKLSDRWTSKMFSLMAFSDSLVAIFAGYYAAEEAREWWGLVGIPMVAAAALAMAGVAAALLWQENRGASSDDNSSRRSAGFFAGIKECVLLLKEERVLLVGLIQSCFEAAVYVFVLVFSPAIDGAVVGVDMDDEGAVEQAAPKGKIFACFMVAVMIGSSVYDWMLVAGASTVATMGAALLLGIIPLGYSAAMLDSVDLTTLLLIFVAYEAAIGIYYPAVGSLRSAVIPEAHHAAVANLFRVPLEVLTAAVYVSYERIGISGCLWCSTGLVAVAIAAYVRLSVIGVAAPSTAHESLKKTH